jgi:hypothetical protein
LGPSTEETAGLPSARTPFKRESKHFFFEKKKQKTFDYYGFGLSG